MAIANPREVIDPSFKDLTFAYVELATVSSNHMWTEGPVWFNDHKTLIFSDIPNNKMYRWTEQSGVSVFRASSNYANGNTRDLHGRLLTCEHGSRKVTRTEYNGSITLVASHCDNMRLNSPNDVIIKSDASIWFTDPSYGILGSLEGYPAEPELPGRFVYYLGPDGSELKVISSDFNQPNGLAFSVDEKKLYIAESGSSHDKSVPSVVRVYHVGEDNRLKLEGDFAEIEPGLPDGLRVDIHDNVWISAADGVHCFSPNGNLLGKIRVPEVVSNLCFGGDRGNQLFITATTSVYSTYVNTSSAISDR